LQPDQAGFRDPKQAVNKKMKKKRTHRPTQVIPARRLQADRYRQFKKALDVVIKYMTKNLINQ